MYAHTSGKVRAYGQLSRTFNTTSGVRQGCPISPFLFNFVIDDILHRTMDKRIISGINVLETGNFLDLEYADDIVCSFDSFEEAQATLNDLSVAAGRYGLSFAPSKCKVMLTDWTGSITPLTLSDEELDFVDSFTYLGAVSMQAETLLMKSHPGFQELERYSETCVTFDVGRTYLY